MKITPPFSGYSAVTIPDHGNPSTPRHQIRALQVSVNSGDFKYVTATFAFRDGG